MKQIYVLSFALFGTVAAHAQTTAYDTIQHGGMARDYMVYVPAAYTGNQPVPLMFNLHGYTSNNAQQNFYANFKPIADTANFIMVLPNGTFDLGGDRYWNVGFAPSPVDDAGFLNTLIDEMINTYNIDTMRIYSTGMSNGGFMSYEMACQNGRIAAIASVTGSMTPTSYDNCSPQRPIPVMEIHGTADATVPYSGSAIMKHIDTVVQYWVNHNQCDPTPVHTAVPNTNSLDGATADHYVYSGGNSGASVELFKVNGGGHTWPGSPIVIGTTCQDFNACAEIWRFFSQYQRLENPTGTTNVKTSGKEIAVYPNPASQYLQIEHEQIDAEMLLVYDAYGRLLYQATCNGSSLQNIDLSGFSAGLYCLELVDKNNQRYNKRFVVSAHK